MFLHQKTLLLIAEPKMSATSKIQEYQDRLLKLLNQPGPLDNFMKVNRYTFLS